MRRIVFLPFDAIPRYQMARSRRLCTVFSSRRSSRRSALRGGAKGRKHFLSRVFFRALGGVNYLQIVPGCHCELTFFSVIQDRVNEFMELKIGNIMAGSILVASLWIYINERQIIAECLSCIMRTGPGHPLPDRLTGCIAIGLVILGLVSAIRLVISERNK